MVDFTLHRDTGIRKPRPSLAKAGKAAELFDLLGPDLGRNLELTLGHTLAVLDADLAVYLPSGSQEPPWVAGGSLSRSCADALKEIGERMTGAGQHHILIQAEDLPGPLAGRFGSLIGVPVGRPPLGIFWAGFKGPQVLTQERIAAMESLASVLGFQLRLKAAHAQAPFAAMARQTAHDLNNLLSGLVTYPELLLLQLDDASPLKPSVALMHESGLQAAELVQDFLFLARPWHSGAVMEIDPGQAVRTYVQSAAHATLVRSYPHVRFHFDLPPAPLKLLGTLDLIPRLMKSLLCHSAQNLEGPGQVRAAIFPEDPGSARAGQGQGIAICVEDTGSPLSEEDRSQLFTPFYAKKTMARQESGLGLCVIKRLVENLGGTMAATAPVKGGNRIKTCLPTLGAMRR